jgi:uncharacterized SAM-binding protein YcdF (DUF218 family)
MHSVTRVQELAALIVVIAAAAIVIAAPFAMLGAGASWRERVLSALAVLEALVAAARRVLGV